MKRSFAKRAALAFWFIGSCGAVVMSCFWIFGMIYTRKVNLGVLSVLALCLAGAWEGFKMFRAERNPN
jgi:hypothetical protein